MSAIPAFEIGAWNAWIFMIWLLILNFGTMLFSKDLYQRAGNPPDMKPSQKYKILSFVSTPFWLLATAYSIFLPFELGTIWFPIGFTIFLLGMIISVVATINFARTQMYEPVTRGVYRYSRHPIYAALVLIYLGVSIASASWVFLLLTVLLAVQVGLSVADEEHYCLEKYDNAYREYMTRTPRWIGIPKS
ncbi:MAG TPA: isoprenylcysteine carboxylmethyltransferase family protein [Dehalococcoidia bacterium]|nr:isoprenylcysteine carboxylmethyltransferase family protein [Dehalococcoidia bacterium]